MSNTSDPKVNNRAFSKIGEDALVRKIRLILMDDTIDQNQAMARLRQVMNGATPSARKEG